MLPRAAGGRRRAGVGPGPLGRTRGCGPPWAVCGTSSARRGRGPGREGREGAGGESPPPRRSEGAGGRSTAAASRSLSSPLASPPPPPQPALPPSPASSAGGSGRPPRAALRAGGAAPSARSSPAAAPCHLRLKPTWRPPSRAERSRAEPSAGTRQGRRGPSAAASATPAAAASRAAAPRGTMGLVGGRARARRGGATARPLRAPSPGRAVMGAARPRRVPAALPQPASRFPRGCRDTAGAS